MYCDVYIVVNKIEDEKAAIALPDEAFALNAIEDQKSTLLV